MWLRYNSWSLIDLDRCHALVIRENPGEGGRSTYGVYADMTCLVMMPFEAGARRVLDNIQKAITSGHKSHDIRELIKSFDGVEIVPRKPPSLPARFRSMKPPRSWLKTRFSWMASCALATSRPKLSPAWTPPKPKPRREKRMPVRKPNPKMPASRYHREAAGISLETAAARAKLSAAWLRQMEAGQGRFPFNKKLKFSMLAAERLSNLYGCSYDAFLPGRVIDPAKSNGASGVPASLSMNAEPSPSVAAQSVINRLRYSSQSRASRRYTRPRVPTLTLIRGGERECQ